MDNSLSQSLPVAENCAACSVDASNDDIYCPNCGYPLKGTETEQKFFMSERLSKEISLEDANNKIKRASYALYYIAGATMIMGLVAYAINKEADIKNSLLITNTILALIYGGLGFWSKKKPLAAIISGASLFALVFILNSVASPMSIFNGLVFKIFIIVYFFRGIKAAIEAEKLKRDLNIE